MQKYNNEIHVLLLFVLFTYVCSQAMNQVGGSITINEESDIVNNFPCADLCKDRSCSFPVRDDCSAYVQCIPNHEPRRRTCPFGTFFDKRTQGCLHTVAVECNADPCFVNGNLVSYPFKDVTYSCNSFWRCEVADDGRRYSKADCCVEGMFYDRTSRTCQRDTDKRCDKKCFIKSDRNKSPSELVITGRICSGTRDIIRCDRNHEILVREVNWGRTEARICDGDMVVARACESDMATNFVVETCSGKRECQLAVTQNQFIERFGDPCPGVNKYLEIKYSCIPACNLRTTRDGAHFYNIDRPDDVFYCGRGFVFSPKDCGCKQTRALGYAPCLVNFNITFDGNNGTEVINNGPNYISHEGVQILNNYGRFWGNSYVCAPFYRGNDRLSRRFALQMRVYLQTENDNQVLVSNCGEDLATSMSISAVTNGSGTFIRFLVLDNMDDVIVMDLPVKIKHWANIIFHFDTANLHARVQYVDGRKIEHRDAREMGRRYIKLTDGTLCVGGCVVENQIEGGLFGFVDEVQISECEVKSQTMPPK